jgi:hypothetical protein
LNATALNDRNIPLPKSANALVPKIEVWGQRHLGRFSQPLMEAKNVDFAD